MHKSQPRRAVLEGKEGWRGRLRPPLLSAITDEDSGLELGPGQLLHGKDLEPVTPSLCSPSSPFDSESLLVSPSPTGKFSLGSRKGSLYNWTPPSTPSFRERYYLVSDLLPGAGTLVTWGDRKRGLG